MSPRWGSTPRLTGRLTVGRKVTLTVYEYNCRQLTLYQWRAGRCSESRRKGGASTSQEVHFKLGTRD
jgi:hypothetical protein